MWNLQPRKAVPRTVTLALDNTYYKEESAQVCCHFTSTFAILFFENRIFVDNKKEIYSFWVGVCPNGERVIVPNCSPRLAWDPAKDQVAATTQVVPMWALEVIRPMTQKVKTALRFRQEFEKTRQQLKTSRQLENGTLPDELFSVFFCEEVELLEPEEDYKQAVDRLLSLPPSFCLDALWTKMERVSWKLAQSVLALTKSGSVAQVETPAICKKVVSL